MENDNNKEKIKFVDANTGQIFNNTKELAYYHNKAKEEKKEEEKKKNPPFIQLTKGVSPAIISKIANQSSIAVRVLMFFFENMDNCNVIMVSQNTLADQLETSRQSISNSIKILDENGAIGIGKISNTNVYIINPEVAWQQAYTKRGLVNLRGQFLLGEDENEKLFNKFQEVTKISKDEFKNINKASTRLIKTKKEKSKNEELNPNDFESISPEDRDIQSFEEQIEFENNIESDIEFIVKTK